MNVSGTGWTAKVRKSYDTTMEWMGFSGTSGLPMKRSGSSSALSSSAPSSGFVCSGLCSPRPLAGSTCVGAQARKRASSASALAEAGRSLGSLAPRSLPFRLPHELWGAFNAVSYALNHVERRTFRSSSSSSYSSPSLGKRAVRQRHVAAAGSGVVAASSSEFGPSPTISKSEAMDFAPGLSLAEALGCIGLAVVVCVAYYGVAYGWSHPLSVRVGLLVALLAVVCLTVARSAFLEIKYQAVQRCETDLGDPDSSFLPLEGLMVHAKVKRGQAPAPGVPRVALHCYHGFGANTFSWQAVQKPLAWALGAQVTSHDMPGFGLTQRPVEVPKYSLSTNGRLGRLVMDTQLAQWALGGQEETNPGGACPQADQSQQQPQQQVDEVDLERQQGDGTDGSGGDASPAEGDAAPVKRVLVGHSLGCACIAAEVINNPQGVSAIVMLAPAIVAFGRPAPPAGGSAAQQAEGMVEQLAGSTPATATSEDPRSSSSDASSAASGDVDSSSSSTSASGGGFHPMAGLLSLVSRGSTLLISTAAAALILALRPLLVLLLRAAVRSRDFWEKGLQGAWHDRSLVSRQVVDAYRLPQLVRGWEAGMVRFLLARVSILSPLWRGFSDARWGRRGRGRRVAEGEAGGRSQVLKLARVVEQHGIKVLIMHGESDMLVPAANSQRLANLLPNCELVVVPRCGHVPQEECPHEVEARITDFVRAL